MPEHFRSGDLTMGVIGLGYVGLPLATIVGEAGIRVTGFDIDESVVDGVNAGASHIADVSIEPPGYPCAERRALRDLGHVAPPGV